MATEVRIKINVAGFNAYRNSPEVMALLTKVAKEIQDRAQANVDATSINIPSEGPDIGMVVHNHATRARARVFTRTLKAMIAESHNRALNRAIQGGGGG